MVEAKPARFSPQRPTLTVDEFIQARPAVAAVLREVDALLIRQGSNERLIWPLVIRKVESHTDEYVIANVRLWLEARARHRRKGVQLVSYFLDNNAAEFDPAKQAQTEHRAESAAAAAIAAMAEYVANDVEPEEWRTICHALRQTGGPAALLSDIPALAQRVSGRVFSPRRVAEHVLDWATRYVGRAQRISTEAVAC